MKRRRIAPTRTRQSMVILANDLYAGEKRRILRVLCHDQTPLITMQCRCGRQSHLHESQIADVPAERPIGARCAACKRPMIFNAGQLQAGFQQMRDEGWIE